MALVETLTSQAESGERACSAATRLVQQLVEGPHVVTIPQTNTQLQSAFERSQLDQADTGV